MSVGGKKKEDQFNPLTSNIAAKGSKIEIKTV